MANFGEQEFVADVAGLRQEAASRIQASISNTELPNGKVRNANVEKHCVK